MGIGDYIRQKKEQFFQAQSADKLKLQKDELVKQRQELQEREKLRQEVNAEKKQIRDLKSAPVRERLAFLRGSSNRASDKMKTINANVAKFGDGGRNPFATGGATKNLFETSGGPFAQKKEPAPESKKGEVITIRIKK